MKRLKAYEEEIRKMKQKNVKEAADGRKEKKSGIIRHR